MGSCGAADVLRLQTLFGTTRHDLLVQKLQRLRSLGSGPHPALHATYTPDGMDMVAGFQVGCRGAQPQLMW